MPMWAQIPLEPASWQLRSWKRQKLILLSSAGATRTLKPPNLLAPPLTAIDLNAIGAQPIRVSDPSRARAVRSHVQVQVPTFKPPQYVDIYK